MDHTHEWCEGERDRKGEAGANHVDERVRRSFHKTAGPSSLDVDAFGLDL